MGNHAPKPADIYDVNHEKYILEAIRKVWNRYNQNKIKWCKSKLFIDHTNTEEINQENLSIKDLSQMGLNATRWARKHIFPYLAKP